MNPQSEISNYHNYKNSNNHDKSEESLTTSDNQQTSQINPTTAISIDTHLNSQNFSNNYQLMNLLLNSQQQNPNFINILNTFKNAQNLSQIGQLYSMISSAANDSNNNNNNNNELENKNFEPPTNFKNKHNANAENQSENFSNDSVLKKKKNGPTPTEINTSLLQTTQIEHTDTDLVGKNAYKSKIKPHRHSHHHHSHTSNMENVRDGAQHSSSSHHRHKGSHKKSSSSTNHQNLKDNPNIKLNTSISSSLTSSSSVSVLTGASSSPSSSPSSSSPSLTPSSSVTSSEPSSPSASPNLETQTNINNRMLNVNTKLAKFTDHNINKANNILQHQNSTDSFPDTFESSNSELHHLMKFNTTKHLAQSISVPRLNMSLTSSVGNGAFSSSNTAPTTPTNLNTPNSKKKLTNNSNSGSMVMHHNECFNFGSNPTIATSNSSNTAAASSNPIATGSGNVVEVGGGGGGASIASSLPSSNSVSNEVKLRLKNHLLKKLVNQNSQNSNPPANTNINNNANVSIANTRALSHPLNHSTSQLPDITNQKSVNSNFLNELTSNKLNNHQLKNNQAQQSSNQNKIFVSNSLEQSQLQQHQPYLLNLFNVTNTPANQATLQQLSISSVQQSSTINNKHQSKIAEELSDENNLRRTTSEPNLKVKSALKDSLLKKRNLLNPFSQAKRENRQQHQQHQSIQQNKNNSHLFSNVISTPSISLPQSNHKKQVESFNQHLNTNNRYGMNQSMLNNSLSGSLSSLPNNQYHYHQHQEQHQKSHQESIIAATAAAVAAAVAAAQISNSRNGDNNQLDIATALKIALRDQLTRTYPNGLNMPMTNSFTNEYFMNNNNNMNEKIPSSLSYPILPSTNFKSDQISNEVNLNHSYDSHLLNKMKTKKDEEHNLNAKKMPKFGHTAHVEEDSERLLEIELKHAAKQNEAKTNMLYDQYKSNDQMNIEENENDNTDEQVEVDDNDDNNNDGELDEDPNRYQLPQRFKPHLERASSHYSYKTFTNNFNRNSHHFYHHVPPPSYNSAIMNAAGGFNFNNYEQLIHHQQQQQQNHFLFAHQDPHLMQMQQRELDDLKNKQLQFHNTNKASFFSDPHLLKSLRIANSNSNANLDIVPKDFSTSSNNFGASKNKLFFNKNNQVDVSKINLSHLPGTSKNKNSNTNIEMNLNTNTSKRNMTDSKMDCTLDTDYEISSNASERVYRYTTGIVYDKIMLKHECVCGNSNNHLETPNRIKSIWNRFKSKDIHEECEVVNTKMATIGDLLNCHNEQYSLIFGSDVDSRPKLPNEYLQNYMMNVCLAPCKGFALTYDQDNSWNEEYTPIACRVAIGSTYELASLVCNGKLKNGFALVRPPGSHAEFNKPLGFCYFNTVAIVAKMLKKNLSLGRILIVDWDVHHGNGTQQMTYNDPNIMYISLHRHDNGSFFPGTGSIYECGQDNGVGKNVNIAWNGKLNPPMSDAEYLAAFRCVVMPIAQAFKPQIVLVSCGFDGSDHHPKELGGYKLSPMCFAYMTKKLMSLAEGKLVLALEGGYDIESLCDCSEMCIDALMDKQIPSFPSETLNAIPNNSAVLDLENVIEVQRQYWPSIKKYRQYIRMSQNQFIGIYNE